MRVLALVIAGLLLGVGVASARTIVGTAGNDRLAGTPRADTLEGLAGNDRISGVGGDDLLLGGPGRDSVDAGAGNDRVSIEYDGARDLTRCGAGTDVVNADLLDTVAADCELVGRRLSRDPYTNPESQHETEVEPDSFTFGRTTVATFQVGRRFDGAATNIGYAVTKDHGRTWTSGLLPGLTVASIPAGPNARASDPVVAYDAAHGVWLISTLGIDGPTTRLAINLSSDGSTWGNALVAAEATGQGIAFDKNWITCDNTPTSPFFGRCYLAYTHSSDDDMLAVTSTTDGGLTWSPPTDIGARPAVGVFPVVRPNGELVVVYLWETRPFVIASSRSTDGGASFAPPVRIAEVDPSSCSTRGLRAFPLPSADVDAAGRVWATWHDCESPGASTNAVFVATSPDGVAWSSPTRVTKGRNAMLPAIGIDAASGRVAIAYHAVRPAGVDVELVDSPGTPSRWSASRRLSAQSMPLQWMPETTSGRMLGDYISVHYARDRPLVVWVLASEPVGVSLRQAVYATSG